MCSLQPVEGPLSRSGDGLHRLGVAFARLQSMYLHPPVPSAGSRGAGSAPVVSVSGGLGVGVPVACPGLGIAVCPDLWSSSVLPSAVEDRSGDRAGSSGDHGGTCHLAPAPMARLAGLDTLRSRGQQRGDLRRNAVLDEAPGAVKLRRGPGARCPDAVACDCAGAAGNWLQAGCRLAGPSQRAVGSVVAVHSSHLLSRLRIRLAFSASPISRDQPFGK
jgi:hypothetical protein